MKTILTLILFSGAALFGQVSANLRTPGDRMPAPSFSLLDSHGKTTTLNAFHGKAVVLNFWATECGGCVRELPYFVEFDQKYRKKQLAVVGLSMDVLYENLKDSTAGWEKVRPFLPTHQMDYPILMGDKATFQRYGLDALPDTYLIDKRGRVAAVYVGIVDHDNIEANIRMLLAER